MSSYLEGYRDGLLASKICERCREKPYESIHHIRPIEFGGGDNKENLILLCNECHDEVEEKTHEIFRENRTVSTDTLRSFVKSEFPTKQVYPSSKLDLCACGCGERVRPGKKWISGHNTMKR